MIERIAKLLNKAERSATPEEAQLYFDKAQALATAHSISLARARLQHPGDVRAPQPVNRTIRIGEPRRHANRHLIALMAAVASVNGLRVDIAHNSTYVIAYGFPDDIDAAEQLWSHIATQMIRFGEQYLATDTWRSDERIVVRAGWGHVRPMTKQTARATYYASFIDTIRLRLAEAHDRAVQRADEQAASDQSLASESSGSEALGSETGAALALRAKDEAVGSFYQQSSTARGTWTGGSSVIGRSRSASAAGSRDAHAVRLGSATQVGGRRAALPR